MSLMIEKMLTIDDTGMPKAPTLRQLQDRDVSLLFQRDKTVDKINYIKEVGVIYYLGDPKSPPRQEGLSDEECLKRAIENYNLPDNYTPDKLVLKIVEKYYKENITEAGVALEALRKSIHLVSISANRINELLNEKLKNELNMDELGTLMTIMKSVSNLVNDLPNLIKSLDQAYENIRNEEETKFARGGSKILSSMSANNY